MNITLKRYLISSFDTFISGFGIGIIPILNNLTVHDISWGALKATILGLVFVGVRAGAKALREYLVKQLESQS